MQQWGRWYSQAPVGGQYFINKKKKVHLPQDEKRLPRTERPTHPPRTTQCTLHPPTDQTFITYSSTAVQQDVQQCTCTQKTNKLVLYQPQSSLCSPSRLLRKQNNNRPPTHHGRRSQCILHPPTDHTFTTYSSTAVQQYVQQHTWYAESS